MEMVAQLDAASMKTLVQGPDGRSQGLVACHLAPRPNSYDRKRHHQQRNSGGRASATKLPVWDFVLIRNDGSGVRLHPNWASTWVECFDVEGHAEAAEPPRRGLGASDGRGTYKRYKAIGTQYRLKFDPAKGYRLKPHKMNH